MMTAVIPIDEAAEAGGPGQPSLALKSALE